MERPDFQNPRKLVEDDITEETVLGMNDIITVAEQGHDEVRGTPLVEKEENMGMFTLGPSRTDPFHLHLEDGNIPVIEFNIDLEQAQGKTCPCNC